MNRINSSAEELAHETHPIHLYLISHHSYGYFVIFLIEGVTKYRTANIPLTSQVRFAENVSKRAF